MNSNQQHRQQSTLRRRIVASLHKQNIEETTSKKHIQKTYKSASTMLLQLYMFLVVVVLLICIGVVYTLQPSLFSGLYYRYIAPPKPSLRIRLLGHFPPLVSPRKDLPSIDGIGGKYSLCTLENAPTRLALHQVRQVQYNLSSSQRNSDVRWMVQEVPPSEVLLSYLNRHQCIDTEESDSNYATFLQLPRRLQVDWAQWCAITIASQATKKDTTTAAVGMLNFDTMRDWEFLQPLGPLLTTTTSVVSGKKEYHHSNLVFLEEPRQIYTALFVFLGGNSSAVGPTISRQVVQQWMKGQLVTTIHDEKEATTSLSAFLYDLIELDLVSNQEDWVVGRIVVSVSGEPPLLQSDDTTEEVVLARQCSSSAMNNDDDNSNKTTRCRFMVVPQDKKKTTETLHRQV